MRKFSANYLVSSSGTFLKNGIVIVGEDGMVLEFIDTTDDLKEISQLVFHNGILVPACRYIKQNDQVPVYESGNALQMFVLQEVSSLSELSVPHLIDRGKQIQEHFPELKIPEIMDQLHRVLLVNGGFVKEAVPGVFLLTGADLPNLHFTHRSRVKKIL